jgi:serine/threonine protein kinase
MLAVKRLQTSEEDDFLRETHISKILARYEHPHLVRLLATYELSGRFHLLFPYAKQNLHTYWEHHSRPKWNRETILWILKQFEGIVSGLSLIHHLRQSTLGSPELDNDNTSMTYSQGPFGYHGDIKPENILWFNDIPGVGQEGVLQIGDFGLGKFRSQLNVSKLDSQKAFGSRTYEPPETALGGPVSSAGDMWSLGCIYLECIIWLLEGWARLEEFFDGRSLVVGEGIEDDKFYTLVKIAHGSAQGEVQGAIVRFSVQDWINGLYNHPLCSSLIRDLLALVQKKLLVVDAKSRATSAQLQDELERLVLKAEVDDKYLLSRVN